jgi:hypothetical protein
MALSLPTRLVAALALSLITGAIPAKADLLSCGVDLGAAGRTKTWSLFSLGGGIKEDADLNGQAEVYGDMGAAGNGNVDIVGHSILHGDLYYHTPGKFKLGKDATITGTTFHNAGSDALLNQGVTDAINASNAAASLAETPGYMSINKIDRSMTITGSGCVVLNITDFNLDAKDTLTLTGPAGTSFVFNISHDFKMKGDARILLGPGIDPLDVLFNVRGTGSDVVVDNRARFRGILMANQRNAQVKGDSTVFGEVIANRIDIKDDAVVKNPRVVSE